MICVTINGKPGDEGGKKGSEKDSRKLMRESYYYVKALMDEFGEEKSRELIGGYGEKDLETMIAIRKKVERGEYEDIKEIKKLIATSSIAKETKKRGYKEGFDEGYKDGKKMILKQHFNNLREAAQKYDGLTFEMIQRIEKAVRKERFELIENIINDCNTSDEFINELRKIIYY